MLCVNFLKGFTFDFSLIKIVDENQLVSLQCLSHNYTVLELTFTFEAAAAASQCRKETKDNNASSKQKWNEKKREIHCCGNLINLPIKSARSSSSIFRSCRRYSLVCMTPFLPIFAKAKERDDGTFY